MLTSLCVVFWFWGFFFLPEVFLLLFLEGNPSTDSLCSVPSYIFQLKSIKKKDASTATAIFWPVFLIVMALAVKDSWLTGHCHHLTTFLVCGSLLKDLCKVCHILALDGLIWVIWKRSIHSVSGKNLFLALLLPS